MATYYVDFVNGTDSNNGLGPDASHASNKPWKTISKTLSSSGIASGDIVYLSPAGPFREVLPVNMTSAVAETQILGDPANQQGFKTSGGVTVSPGPVIWTAYTTNDKTAPSGTTLLNLNGRDFLTFKNIMFMQGNAILVTATTTTSTNITFQDCAFIQGFTSGAGGIFSVTAAFATALNWTVDRCRFLVSRGNNGVCLLITLTTGSGSDYDSNFQITNCVMIGQNAFAISVAASGASAQKGGGVDVRNCSFIGLAAMIAGTNIATSIPSTVNNSFVYSGNANCVNANTSGMITEDYNLFLSSAPRTNVTAGTHSISDGSYAPNLHIGQERIWYGLDRPFAEPMASSPLLGFANDGTQTAYDERNRLRPAGGASANPGAGALERGNTAAKETSTVQDGSTAGKITGPGYQDLRIPVNAAATTVSAYLRYDSTYAGTRPQLLLQAQPEIGVSAQTITASVAALNAFEQNSTAQFTPTGKGWVVLRVQSNDTNGGGAVYFDTVSVT